MKERLQRAGNLLLKNEEEASGSTTFAWLEFKTNSVTGQISKRAFRINNWNFFLVFSLLALTKPQDH